MHDSFSNSALLHNVGTLVRQGKVGQLEGAVVVAVVKTSCKKLSDSFIPGEVACGAAHSCSTISEHAEHVNFPSLLSAVHDSFSNSALLHNVGTLVRQGKVGQLEGAVVVAVVKTSCKKLSDSFIPHNSRGLQRKRAVSFAHVVRCGPFEVSRRKAMRSAKLGQNL